jgi:class 3 adenylate cyclase
MQVSTEGYVSHDHAFEYEGFAPIWQFGPSPISSSSVMGDLASIEVMRDLFSHSIRMRNSLMSMHLDVSVLTDSTAPDLYTEDAYFRTHMEDRSKDSHSLLVQPIFENFEDDNPKVVAFLIGVLSWRSIFFDVLPESTKNYYVDVKDSCGSHFAYEVNGKYNTPSTRERPKLDHFNNMVYSQYLTEEQSDYHDDVLCRYTLTIYPTEELEALYISKKPILYTMAVLLIFAFTVIIFLFYDWTVYLRQSKVMNEAIRSNAVVSSLFPKAVRQRLMQDTSKINTGKGNKKGTIFSDVIDNDDPYGGTSRPIADLFPEASVMFADVVGFTAWSSTREPSQVFTLLESVYSEFDELAKHRQIFKIETVGDCYVAACGVPESCKTHALNMCRFADDCVRRMTYMTKKLEVELGPDTGDLGLRVGIHSGPVTAGVLRGERARFQLFGDTVNTAARMESTGSRNQIQVSQETADLLMSAGKGHWLKARHAPVYAKGKGELQTYWLELKNETFTTASAGSDTKSAAVPVEVVPQVDVVKLALETDTKNKERIEKQNRLVDWNTEILQRLLVDIISHRKTAGSKRDAESDIEDYEMSILKRDGIVLDEFKEVITLPAYTDAGAHATEKDATVVVSDVVNKQLRNYVGTIAELYRDNAFHNFEHASHVTMSCVKLLSRIVAPDKKQFDEGGDIHKCLHDYTYGITSDPLTQFAVVLSGLMHDVDHTGVPNAQLVKERASIAIVYQNKSVAEQNSIDIAWNLLMEKDFIDLRRAIYTSVNELQRFRQLVVNTVLATDIMDKDLKDLRNARWNKAFSETATDEFDHDRKATIVIEHLIQASDVAHTMQHWHIYRKWNARLFEEMYTAYLQGRAEKNPADFWYQGELGFFDFYIIPLAMKLRSCGVFGVSSDEYLNYARQNRQEWERKGRQVVAEVVEMMPQALQSTLNNNNE